MLAEDSSTDDHLVIVLNAIDINSGATLRFLDSITGDKQLQHIVERTEVKIYEARHAAILIAFAFGSNRELRADSKLCFHLGERFVQVGNPDQYDTSGFVAPLFLEQWRKYQNAVIALTKRLGLDSERMINVLHASGRLELSAEECLQRGLVSRLF